MLSFDTTPKNKKKNGKMTVVSATLMHRKATYIPKKSLPSES